MAHNLTFDFSVNNESRTITIKREFAAKRDRVWDAYTKSEVLDQWWAPKPWKARTKTMDFRNGGTWLYAMVGPAGEEHWALLNYTVVSPKTQFSGKDAFADAQGTINKDMPQSKWDVTFADNGDNTLVQSVITFDDLAQLEATIKMGFKEGITMGMENLDELLLAN